ncbi:LLM class flavin-dependent oxidoreductase [Nocardioides insulae]|uniref:LLM class flavin-dependent oxidoreductase n=1 Tax=Nocardioides insulae TaxID=394734 RepID=UPI00040AEA11|nr:LLM class flavin-dependent oxidoreductase [Nocardioides insulae]
MTDDRPDLLFGTFVTPTAREPRHAVDLAVTADRAGLDLVTYQDHPYQPAFLDTWTLLTYAAARTERIRLSGNVLNLPLRPPLVLARAAASLDLLSGGRFELGLGAGGFWDAIVAMGGRRLTPGQAVDALSEAITLIRDAWDTDVRGGLRSDGPYYPVQGAKRGPRPAHDIGIWLGALKPRMLALTGAKADGWIPSLGYLPRGADSLPEMNARIDEGAVGAGRDPRAVRRLLNIPDGAAQGGSVKGWVDQLVELAVTHRITGFILSSDDPLSTERYAAEVAPEVRRIVAAEASS